MYEKPNILIIMCDQLNASVLSCYGGQASSPNLDRLAREGVIFKNATCPTPLCSPSRGSLITGLYPHTHGIVTNVWGDYPAIGSPPTEEAITENDTTTEKLLNKAGYETHHYGKWHLRGKELSYYPDMFGEHREYAEGMSKTFEEVRKRPRGKWMDWYGWAMPVSVSPKLSGAVNALGGGWKDKRFREFITKMGRLELPLRQNFDIQVADRTIDCLRRLGVNPFMITSSFNYPHDPNVVPSPYYEAFSPDEIRLPENYGNLEERFKEEWSRQIVTDLGEVAVREFLRIYYGCIRLVDDQVGRILNALEETGRAENTIVVFTADHGDMAGGHGMVWKSTTSFYEEVVRVPLIIRYPQRIKPDKSDIDASLVDLMPTLLDLAGHPVPHNIQGHSLAPYLLGKRDQVEAPPYTFCERVEGNAGHTRKVSPGTAGSFMIRGRGWKYIRYADGEEFLYNLTADPGETNNLANEPKFKSDKKELSKELEKWLATTGYPNVI